MNPRFEIDFLLNEKNKITKTNISRATLPESNKSQLKINGWKIPFPFGARPVFMGHVPLLSGAHPSVRRGHWAFRLLPDFGSHLAPLSCAPTFQKTLIMDDQQECHVKEAKRLTPSFRGTLAPHRTQLDTSSVKDDDLTSPLVTWIGGLSGNAKRRGDPTERW